MKQLLVLVVLLSVAVSSVLSEEAPSSVSLRELPAAAQKTIREQLRSANVKEIERNTENGEVTFTVNVSKSGEEREFIVREDGKLLSVEVSLEEAPPAVQR